MRLWFVLGWVLLAMPAMAQTAQLTLDYRICETHHQTVQYSIPNKFGAGPLLSSALDSYEPGWEKCADVAKAHKAAIDARPAPATSTDDATRTRLDDYGKQP